MVGLPAFTTDGLLPPEEYTLTLGELLRSPLVLGQGDPKLCPNWDARWREKLAANLAALVRQLWAVGVVEIFIDGSFVEDKDHPNDIDGYFVCDLRRLASGDLERELNALDPFQIWTWDPATRRPYRGYPKRQLPMWHQYRVELYLHYGQPSGIRDKYGHELEFPSGNLRVTASRRGSSRSEAIHDS
jgi:hypothetical protein